MRHGAVFSQRWVERIHKAFRLVIFAFITVTRFAISYHGMYYASLSLDINMVNLAADGTRAYPEPHLDTPIERN